MANHLGVGPLIARLSTLSESSRCSDAGADRLEVLILRHEMTEAVLDASLEIDHVLGDIDNELMYIRMARETLQSRQDRFSKITNVAAIVSGGILGVIGTALQFSADTANDGNALSIAGGGASTAISLLVLRQLRGGQQLPAGVPNMLAELLSVHDTEGSSGSYTRSAPIVWAFLNAVPVPKPDEPGGPTRLQKLSQEWTERGLIAGTHPPGPTKTIDALTSSGPGQRKLSIEQLDVRAAMLVDVYATVALMKHSLSALARDARRVSACEGK